MFTLFKKVVHVGIGIASQTKEEFHRLEEQGKQHQSEGAEKVLSFLSSGEKMEAEFKQKGEDICKRITQTVRIPSRSDIDRLEKGLADLAGVVQGMRSGK
ncbi:MAG: hypothetical protein AAB317_04955 [Nitrospirota bacterium]